MRYRTMGLSTALFLVLSQAVFATPPETTGAPYLKLRHNGSWGAEIWELTIDEHGTVRYRGGFYGEAGRGGYREATYQLAPREFDAIRASVREFNESNLPEFVPGEGTDSPELAVIEFVPEGNSRTHGLGLSHAGSPARNAPMTRTFMKLWSAMIQHLSVPNVEFPYGPKNLR